MKAIVTTTINPPTKTIISLSKKNDWKLYIVGDQKTPHDLYQNENWTYLNPEYQEKRYPKLSKMLGWNNIQRRNIGFVEAVKDGAEIIATIDDDNIPYNNWGENLSIGKEITCHSYTNEKGLFDPLCLTNISKYWHRGYPLSLVETRKENQSKLKSIKVSVQADLWNGKPDVDAVSRLMYGYKDENILAFSPYSSPKTIFSSQNAFLERAIMPHYAVLPFCGRMDDIWGCIVLQNRTKCEVLFYSPSTFHDRNHHNAINDLKEEIIGYDKTMKILENEKYLPSKCRKFLDEYYKEMTNV